MGTRGGRKIHYARVLAETQVSGLPAQVCGIATGGQRRLTRF
jgi:hypothetical protein